MNIAHFVPDEICVVFSLDATADVSLYEKAKITLNPLIKEAIANANVSEGTAFERDMAPVTLRARWDKKSDLLGVLTRENVPISDEAPQGAYVPLANDAGGIALCFYRITVIDNPDHTPNLESESVVREMVNLVNQTLRGRSGAYGSSHHWTITGATPNWIGGSTQHEITGGPGAPPDPTGPEGGDIETHFPANTLLEGLVQVQRDTARSTDPPPCDTILAILDTSPRRAMVTQKAHLNGLLSRVGTHVKIGEPHSVDHNGMKFTLPLADGYFAHLRHFLPHWVGEMGPWRSAANAAERQQRRDHYYAIPDHGLMAAGIIEDIAPGVEVHLIRVLDNAGVGDLVTLTTVLAALPEILLSGENARKHLVVNLSLMVDVPLDSDIVAFWLPHTSALSPGKALNAQDAEVLSVIRTLHVSLQETIAALAQRGVLVVAAAGNENLVEGSTRLVARPSRPEPRYPARYETMVDTVIAVGATNQSDQASDFSNRANEDSPGRGIAVFGGNEIAAGQAGSGVIGVCSAEMYPFDKGYNTSGWVLWAGTSFAAPTISAIAACIWCNPGLAGLATNPVASAVIDTLGTFTTQDEPDLNARAIVSYQVRV